MDRTTFNAIRQQRDLELAVIMAELWGISPAVIQLWTLTKGE